MCFAFFYAPSRLTLMPQREAGVPLYGNLHKPPFACLACGVAPALRRQDRADDAEEDAPRAERLRMDPTRKQSGKNKHSFGKCVSKILWETCGMQRCSTKLTHIPRFRTPDVPFKRKVAVSSPKLKSWEGARRVPVIYRISSGEAAPSSPKGSALAGILPCRECG